MVSFTISLSSEGLRTSFHPTPTPTPTPTDSIYSSLSHSRSRSHPYSRSNSHSISISNRSASPPPLDTPPPPYYQKYQHPHQQLLYRSQHQSQSHRPYFHHRSSFITGPSSSTSNQNQSIEGLERLLPPPSRTSPAARGRARTKKFVRSQQIYDQNHTNHQESSNRSHRERKMIWKRHSIASDGSHPGMDPVEEHAPVERRMSFGRGGAGNIRRPSVGPFASSSATEDTAANANGTSSSARRRSSVWSAINSITPGSSPDGKRGAGAVPESGGGAASGSGSGLMSLFTRRKRDSSAGAAGD